MPPRRGAWSVMAQKLDVRRVGRWVCVPCRRSCARRPFSARRHASHGHGVPAEAARRSGEAGAACAEAVLAPSRPVTGARGCQGSPAGPAAVRLPAVLPAGPPARRVPPARRRPSPAERAGMDAKRERSPGGRRAMPQSSSAAAKVDVLACRGAPDRLLCRGRTPRVTPATRDNDPPHRGLSSGSASARGPASGGCPWPYSPPQPIVIG